MALPNAITLQRGTKDTSDPLSQEKPLEISTEIYKYNPNKHKALSSAMRMAVKRKTSEHIFYHLERAPLANFIEYAGAEESSQGVTGLVFKTGTGARVAAGSRAYFPAIEEIMRFTADFASTTTSAAVARNFGRGVASTSLLKPGMKGVLMTPAMIQGFTTGNGVTGNAVLKTFATTEVNWPVQLTNIEAAERSRLGNPFQVALGDAIEQSQTQMENELLFGAYVNDSSTYSHPISASQGVDNFITTNVFSALSLSRMDLWDILAFWKHLNKDGGDIWSSFAFKALITEWAMAYEEINVPISGQGAVEGEFGLSIDKVKTPAGTFMLYDVDVLGQEEYLLGKVYMVPKPAPGKPRLLYRPLVENMDLDIRYYPIKRDEVHAKEGEVYGAYGWQLAEEELWQKIEDLQFA